MTLTRVGVRGCAPGNRHAGRIPSCAGCALPRVIRARADSPLAHHMPRDLAWIDALRCDLLLWKQEVARQSRIGQGSASDRAGEWRVCLSVIGEHGRRPAEAARGLVVYLIGEHARQQRMKVLLRQRCKLQKAGVQPLQLTFRHRVEVDTTNTLLGTRTLQPTKEDLRRAGIGDRAFTQATLDLRVRRRLTLSACGPADFIAAPSTG